VRLLEEGKGERTYAEVDINFILEVDVQGLVVPFAEFFLHGEFRAVGGSVLVDGVICTGKGELDAKWSCFNCKHNSSFDESSFRDVPYSSFITASCSVREDFRIYPLEATEDLATTSKCVWMAIVAVTLSSALLEFASRAAISADLARKASDGSVPHPIRELWGPFAGCGTFDGMEAAKAATNTERQTIGRWTTCLETR
jgi:hypothetical protein